MICDQRPLPFISFQSPFFANSLENHVSFFNPNPPKAFGIAMEDHAIKAKGFYLFFQPIDILEIFLVWHHHVHSNYA